MSAEWRLEDTRINLMELLLVTFYAGWEYGTNDKPSEDVAKRWIARAVVEHGFFSELLGSNETKTESDKGE